MGATNAVVMVVDKSEMDMFDLNFDVHGRYLEGLGMLQVMQARMMEDILG